MKRAIAYYRVSTSRQGRSGLGLEAQQFTINNYCQYSHYRLIDAFTEVRSTRKRQSKLLEAIEKCRRLKATLLVARQDRLGRDVELIARLVKSEIEIIVADNPDASRLTIHVTAAMDEEQRERISKTTKEALAAARKRGVVLGKNGKRLAKQNKKAAQAFARKLYPMLKELKKRGITTVRAIAQELNVLGISTFRGDSHWHATTVFALLHRLNK